jgi:hypothetical protein
MSTSQPTNLPLALRAARREFNRWRRQHRPRARLPEALWRKAATLADQHGLSKTARALGLSYDSLKKHRALASNGLSKEPEVPCEFLELVAGATPPRSITCTFEVDDGQGASVRMHVQGICMTDLVSFASAWRSRPA